MASLSSYGLFNLQNHIVFLFLNSNSWLNTSMVYKFFTPCYVGYISQSLITMRQSLTNNDTKFSSPTQFLFQYDSTNDADCSTCSSTFPANQANMNINYNLFKLEAFTINMDLFISHKQSFFLVTHIN